MELKKLSVSIMYRVMDDLYYGDLHQAGDHRLYRENKVDVVVKLCSIEPIEGYPDNVEVHDRFMLDGDGNSKDDFIETVQLVLDELGEGNTVFVHCAAGESRSVSVTAAVKAHIEDRNFQKALHDLCEERNIKPEEKLIDHGILTAQAFKYGDESGQK